MGRSARGRSPGDPGMLHGSERAAPAAAHHPEGCQELHDHVGKRAGIGQRAEEQCTTNLFESAAGRQGLSMRPELAMEQLWAQAYTVPTDRPEADGTASWSS